MGSQAVCGVLQNTLMPLRAGSRLRNLSSKRHAFASPRSCVHNAAPATSKAGQPSPRGAHRTRRWRNLAIVAGLGGAAYLADRELNASAIARNLRCAYYGALILADFKLNFSENASAEEINALHERVAARLHYVCTANGGLFIKLGQSIGIQATILPKPYREAFSTIFDAAPQIPYEEVEKVFKAEFGGKLPLEIFESFDKTPLASASIAQVHRARLRLPSIDGKPGEAREVAVKVQKPAIKKQLNLDLWSYHALLWIYEKAFQIPCYFVAPYVSQQIKQETDFLNEAQNSERTARFIADEPSLRDKIYVPKVHWHVTTPRIMTADFIEGATKLNDKDGIQKMGFSVKEVMDPVVSAFSAMIFVWGHLHCDPHPGNVLIRPNPQKPKKPQVVIIDHGLYIDLTPSFRRSYSELWRALFVMDTDTIDRIGRSWGIANSNLFASATLLRPTTVKKEDRPKPTVDADGKTAHQAQRELKERLKTMLENEQLIPRELIFLARSMRMVQAVNQGLGSPSNRINILAYWASEGLRRTYPLDASIDKYTRDTLQIESSNRLRTWFNEKRKLWTFQVVLFFIDVGFVLTKVRQVWLRVVRGREEGFEDLLQQQVNQMAREEFGMELDDNAFAG